MMLAFFRNNSKLKITITLLVALLTFNYCIDTEDNFNNKIFHGYTLNDNLEINDVETFYELVTEVFLGIDNHVEEGNELDYEQLIKKHQIVYFEKLFLPELKFTSINITIFIHQQKFLDNLSKSVDSPPPKV
jgi:hypothetical protein